VCHYNSAQAFEVINKIQKESRHVVTNTMPKIHIICESNASGVLACGPRSMGRNVHGKCAVADFSCKDKLH
jgi:hypothetical protein